MVNICGCCCRASIECCAKWLAHFHVHSAVAEQIFQDSEAHKLGLLSIMRGQALVERYFHLVFFLRSFLNS